MTKQLILLILGLCSGITVAGGVTGFLIGIALIPRYAGITHSGKRILLYEDCLFIGTVLGNFLILFPFSIPCAHLFLLLFGLFSGIFLGGWVMALAEMADIFPILFRHLKIKKGFYYIIFSLAIGKILGALHFFSSNM